MNQEKIKNYKRATAIKIHINHLLSGNYVKEDIHSYIDIKMGFQVSRVRILGTIIRKWMPSANTDEATSRTPQATIIIDDGTGTLRIKAWNEDIKKLEEFEIGDIVDIIGRIREYDEEIYVTPEIIKKIEDPNWELVRELEIIEFLEKIKTGLEIQPKSTLAHQTVDTNVRKKPQIQDEKGNFKDQMIELIKKLDETKGVGLKVLKKHINISETDFQDTLKELINEGTIYQPSPGKYKIL